MVNLIALNLARAEIKVNCFVTFRDLNGGTEAEKLNRRSRNEGTVCPAGLVWQEAVG